MRKITENELLKVGTKVQFKCKRGHVKSAKWVKDQFGDRICLHEITVTHQAINKYIGKGKMATIWEPFDAYFQPVNYSFIYVL